MPIRRKSSIEKKYYETIGQGLLFGHDNLGFKTVNLPKKQRLTNLCKKFSIKHNYSIKTSFFESNKFIVNEKFFFIMILNF